MANRISSFEELQARKTAKELVRLACLVFRRASASRDFVLQNQIQQAAISAMGNVAEGFEQARSAKKLQFYNVARASCGKVSSLSSVMRGAKYISDTQHKALLKHVTQNRKLISELIRSTRAHAINP
jgi:four helix bundle protein